MIEPMLAKPSEGLPPSGGDWTFEVKWDGLRGIAVIRGGSVRLQSRSGKTELSSRFPAIAEQLATLPDCVLDGELLRPGTKFMPGSPVPKDGLYLVFDILEAPPQGAAIREWPLRARRSVLSKLLPHTPNVLMSPSFDNGEDLLEMVTAWGWEGVVAKRRDSRYLVGRRSDSWLKIKVRPEQEFIVCGWTEGKGGRDGTIGSLVLGYFDNGRLVYAGRVGSRLADEKVLRRALVPAERPTLSEPRFRMLVHWVEPTVIVQVAFQRWTDDGVLLQPTSKGLRSDKAISEVVRES